MESGARNMSTALGGEEFQNWVKIDPNQYAVAAASANAASATTSDKKKKAFLKGRDDRVVPYERNPRSFVE
ncbi:hypothetical protein MRB53_015177 [Persea americana]|uniref:Uncharacterized protein n=1 Tax=Persea americana TaxID=3435 RepID=A0ACC2KD23_PERAE|nr:hypothetical protein MRB53_015177 [Persea americana]